MLVLSTVVNVIAAIASITEVVQRPMEMLDVICLAMEMRRYATIQPLILA